MSDPQLNHQIQSFEQSLITLDRKTAHRIAEDQCLNLSPDTFIEQIMIPAMERIGTGWEQDEIALSQIYMSSRICEEIIETLLPAGSVKSSENHNIAIAVFEDYHILGKRIVHTMLRSSGLNNKDYRRVAKEDLINPVKEDHISIQLLSTLMLPSALRIKEVRDQLPENVKMIVGGAPFRFDDRLYKDIGADYMGRNSSDALSIIKQLGGITL